MEMTDAHFHGYDGPFYSSASARLQNAINNSQAKNAVLFERAAGQLSWFVKVDRSARTSDGYSWYCSINFGFEQQSLSVLIPWANERAIAYYTKHLPQAQADQIISDLAKLIADQDQSIASEFDHDSQADKDVDSNVKFDPRELVRFWVDDVQIDPGFRQVSGNCLKAEVTSVQYWPEDGTDPASATLWVFMTPIATFEGLESQLDKLDKTNVDLTQMPSLLAYVDVIDIKLQDNYYYDIIGVGYKEDGTGRLLIGGRYTTAKVDKVPSTLTLDEAKLLALVSIGFSPEQGHPVQAFIEAMTAWGEYGRNVIAGFDFGPFTNSSSLHHFGIMVSHLGNVEFYHGHTAAQTRQFIEVHSQPNKRTWLKKLFLKK